MSSHNDCETNHENVDVQGILADLKDHWKELGPVRRGDLEKALMSLGLTGRGIAKAVGHSEGSIRRDLKAAQLSECERQKILDGQRAQTVFKAVEKQRREEQWRRQMADKGAEKALEDKAVVALLQTLDDLNIGGLAHREMIIMDAGKEADLQFCRNHKNPERFPLPIPAEPSSDFTKVMRNSVTTPVEPGTVIIGDALWIEPVITGFASGLLKIAPDYLMRMRVIHRAWRGAGKRNWKN